MTLHETLMVLNGWAIIEQVKFCDRISQNITIGIRVILDTEEESAFQKLEAIKWVNEFHHRINNLRYRLKKTDSSIDTIGSIENNAKHYASKNKLTKRIISESIRHSLLEMKKAKQ